MWLFLLGRDNQALDLGRQLVGVAHRPARAVAERLKAVLLVSSEDLVAGFSRDAEGATEITHRLGATNRRRSSMTEHSFQGINTSRHLAERVTHVSGTTCHLCLGPLRGRSSIERASFRRPGEAESTALRRGSHVSGYRVVTGTCCRRGH